MDTLLRRATRKIFSKRNDPLWPVLHEQATQAIAPTSEQFGPVLHVVAVLARIGWGNFSQEEEAYIGRIEHRRAVTNSSKAVVRYRDYGAGSPAVRRTISEMAEGVIVERIVGEISQISSKSPALAALLFSLVRQQRPLSCVEMGTCVGVSGSYIAAALKLNGCGKLVTLEGGEALADVARRNFSALSLEGIAQVVVGPFHETLAQAFMAASPIDFIFIDGHHDEDATKNYLAMALPYLAPMSVAVFDDINWSDGMKRAWSSVMTAPQCMAHFSLRDFGIAVLRREGAEVQ